MEKQAKKRVKVTPAWLDALLHPAWLIVAEALAAIAVEYRVTDDNMRLWVNVASQLEGISLVDGVRAIANGDIEIQIHETSPSGLILPIGNGGLQA